MNLTAFFTYHKFLYKINTNCIALRYVYYNGGHYEKVFFFLIYYITCHLNEINRMGAEAPPSEQNVSFALGAAVELIPPTMSAAVASVTGEPFNAFASSNYMKDNIKIEYLTLHQEWIPIIAQWTYSAWHKYDPTLALENEEASIKTRLNTDKIPLTLVAIYNNEPIGTVNLKTSVNVPNVPKNKVWLGSLYVEPPYRNRGIGGMLLSAIFKEAEKFNVKELYLFTSDITIVPWYIKHGWKVVNTLPYQNHMVTVMCFDVQKMKNHTLPR